MEVHFNIQKVPNLAILISFAERDLRVKFIPTNENYYSSILKLNSKEDPILCGDYAIAKYFARISKTPLLSSSQKPEELSLIDQWLDFVISYPQNQFSDLFPMINAYLTFKTFFVGYSLSIVDYAIFTNCFEWYQQPKESQYPNFDRWFNYMKTIPECIRLTKMKPFKVEEKKPEVESKKKTIGKKVVQEKKAAYFELPNAEMGKVVTRFPPEPSGYLHIGHAKAALLNQHYANQYKGKLIVRFDDTNPVTETEEYEKCIREDLDKLEIKANLITHTSDSFPVIFKYADQIIQQGDAYVDDTESKDIKIQRKQGIDSKNRNNSIEENLKLWNEMKIGSQKGLTCVLRAKISMTHECKAMRDPAFIDGVTHALRSDEYNEKNLIYHWVCEHLKIREPHIHTFSRLNLQYTPLSKRVLRWFVQNKKTNGWDDPRFPTIRGVMRRGMTVEALQYFIQLQGSSRTANLMEWNMLWSFNKSIIDPKIPRFTSIDEKDYVVVEIEGVSDKIEVKQWPKLKTNPSLGMKDVRYLNKIIIQQSDAVLLKENEEITLINWGNCIIKQIHKDGNNSKILRISAVLHLEGDFKKTKWKLTWLPNTDDLLKIKLVDVGYLITKQKLEKKDPFEKFVAENTWFEEFVLGDPQIAQLKKGDIFQLERKGYYIVDNEFSKETNSVVLLNIPDGRKKKEPKKK
ncbi:glutamate--tRNA ligase cytoplasmic [Anaeramoeba ignava]|uniref:Glutamate--tRNA ligase cytoplasmic n=1 Tax=Anaeramoeba ignava TaxID=1746090 RepID=A0A9Q0L855_ANAIG|nr:glutamate--tRNA ligase cytoplasmic [Anaeramoeba ignava]